MLKFRIDRRIAIICFGDNIVLRLPLLFRVMVGLEHSVQA